MNATVQRVLTWTGPVMLVLWVVSFIALAGFIPPPRPLNTPDQVVAMYRDHTTLIRLGLVITMFASALLVPFASVISAQMRRIEAARATLAGTQLASAALLSVEFILPVMMWLTAAYRLDHTSARLIQMLNDMGWIMFVGVISSAVVQFASIGFAILVDQRPQTVFPRWAGYLNIWVALLVSPAGIIVFFKHGPFAWNGLVSFFLPLTAFAVWMVVMFVLLRRAIDQEAAELA
jgi:hypothetical protein